MFYYFIVTFYVWGSERKYVITAIRSHFLTSLSFVFGFSPVEKNKVTFVSKHWQWWILSKRIASPGYLLFSYNSMHHWVLITMQYVNRVTAIRDVHASNDAPAITSQHTHWTLTSSKHYYSHKSHRHGRSITTPTFRHGKHGYKQWPHFPLSPARPDWSTSLVTISGLLIGCRLIILITSSKK